MIELAAITKSFEMDDVGALRVLHGIGLHVRQGEMVAIMGPSGSGKAP
jgi:ABC-type lipoprotein export system ATPase subunit